MVTDPKNVQGIVNRHAQGVYVAAAEHSAPRKLGRLEQEWHTTVRIGFSSAFARLSDCPTACCPTQFPPFFCTGIIANSYIHNDSVMNVAKYVHRKLSDGWLGAEPSTLLSTEPSRADEIPSQQRLHPRSAASTVSSQLDTQDPNNQSLQHQTEPPLNKTTASLILLKQRRQLSGTFSGSRRRSSGLPLAEDTLAFTKFETSGPQNLRYVTMRPHQAADEPDKGTQQPPPLLTALPIDGISLPSSIAKTNDATIYHHPCYTRSSSLTSQPADLSSIERLQPSIIVIGHPRRSVNGPVIASIHLQTSPAQIHSVTYAETDVESGIHPEAPTQLCIALPPPREIRTSQYLSMELLSGGDNREVGMLISARRSYSLDTESPSSQSSSSSRSILPSSSSSAASSVYSGSQPESPQSVLQGSAGFRSLPVIGSLFSSMQSKSAVCRKVRFHSPIIRPPVCGTHANRCCHT